MNWFGSWSGSLVGRFSDQYRWPSAVLVPGVLMLLVGSARFSAAIARPHHLLDALKTAVEIEPDIGPEELGSEEPFDEAYYTPAVGSAQMTEITEPDGTTVILPPGYQSDRAYPALVLMPYTDRTALHMFNWGIYDAYQRRQDNSFVIIMPPGQGSSANWSGYGWESFVSEYEQYINQSLDPIAAKYSVDPDQMVIGGFSLGGDLSWTLSLRNPDIFSGAIVMGSMSNYRDAQSAQMLAARDFRYFMVMGGYDGNRGAMYEALDSLDQHSIEYHYEEVLAAGHGDLPEQMQHDLFLSAMDYVLAERLAVSQR